MTACHAPISVCMHRTSCPYAHIMYETSLDTLARLKPNTSPTQHKSSQIWANTLQSRQLHSVQAYAFPSLRPVCQLNLLLLCLYMISICLEHLLLHCIKACLVSLSSCLLDTYLHCKLIVCRHLLGLLSLPTAYLHCLSRTCACHLFASDGPTLRHSGSHLSPLARSRCSCQAYKPPM